MRWTALLAIVLLAAGTAHAGPISDVYQNDGGSGADASDDCKAPSPGLNEGDVSEGQMTPEEDEIDAWALEVSPAEAGETREVTLHASAPPETRAYLEGNFSLTVYAPGCGDVVAKGDQTGENQWTAGPFTVEQAGSYSVVVVLEDHGPSTMEIALPYYERNGHCSPYCSFETSMTVS